MRFRNTIIGILSIIAIFPWASRAQTADDFAAAHDRGEFYIRKNDLAAAVVYLQRAYDIDPSNEDNAYDLALAYLELGLLEKSRPIITASLARHDKADFHNLLGELESKEGHIQPAAEQYRTAAQIDPSEKNLFDLGMHLLTYRGSEAAETIFSYGVSRYPKSAELNVGLGISYYSLGKYDEAIDQLCRAVDLNPTDTRALEFLGKMYDVAPDKSAEVTTRLERFAREYPNNAAANYYYALSLRGRSVGRLDPVTGKKAQELLERSVKLNPDFADAHFELGLLYEDKAEDGKAIEEYRTAIQLEPQPSKFHYRLARVYRRDGNSPLADAEFRKFQELKAHEENSQTVVK